MDQSPRQILKCVRDVIVLGGMVAVVNGLVSRADFGWMELNPTPWLLVPVLIGARYGALAGLFSGALTGVLIAVVQGGRSVDATKDFLQDHPFFFSALVLAGYLAGECGRWLSGSKVLLDERCQKQAFELQRMSAELELQREAKHELQSRLALHNATLAGLDDDLRKLVTGSAESLMAGLLTLLHQHAQVTSVGLYLKRGDKLERVAVLHPTKPLKESLSLDENPLARRALEERSVMSVKAAMDTTKEQPFLAALPFERRDQVGVLLVQDMPLRAFNWSNLARIELIMLWTFAMDLVRGQFGAPGELVPVEAWKVLINQAIATDQLHDVPSMVIKQQVDAASEKTILKMLPPTAAATRLPEGSALAILLPLGGEMEAGALVAEWQRLGIKKSPVKYPVTRGPSAEEFWKHVLQP